MRNIRIEKSNPRQGYLTAGEEAGGVEGQHVSLIGNDWSVPILGVESNPLRLPASATSAA